MGRNSFGIVSTAAIGGILAAFGGCYSESNPADPAASRGGASAADGGGVAPATVAAGLLGRLGDEDGVNAIGRALLGRYSGTCYLATFAARPVAEQDHVAQCLAQDFRKIGGLTLKNAKYQDDKAQNCGPALFHQGGQFRAADFVAARTLLLDELKKGGGTDDDVAAYRSYLLVNAPNLAGPDATYGDHLRCAAACTSLDGNGPCQYTPPVIVDAGNDAAAGDGGTTASDDDGGASDGGDGG